MQIANEELPEYPRRKSPRVPLVVAGRVKALRDWRDKLVGRLGIDPALVCTKSLMTAIAIQKPRKMSDFTTIKEMKNWQKKEFGREILQVMKQVR